MDIKTENFGLDISSEQAVFAVSAYTGCQSSLERTKVGSIMAAPLIACLTFMVIVGPSSSKVIPYETSSVICKSDQNRTSNGSRKKRKPTAQALEMVVIDTLYFCRDNNLFTNSYNYIESSPPQYYNIINESIKEEGGGQKEMNKQIDSTGLNLVKARLIVATSCLYGVFFLALFLLAYFKIAPLLSVFFGGVICVAFFFYTVFDIKAWRKRHC
jgi:hypothetical protein